MEGLNFTESTKFNSGETNQDRSTIVMVRGEKRIHVSKGVIENRAQVHKSNWLQILILILYDEDITMDR